MLDNNPSILWLPQEELLEEVVACPRDQVPEVATGPVGAHAVAVVVVVETRTHHQGQHSEGAPRELVSGMPLRRLKGLEADPVEEGEAVHAAAQHQHRQRRRALHEDRLTKLAKISSMGWV